MFATVVVRIVMYDFTIDQYEALSHLDWRYDSTILLDRSPGCIKSGCEHGQELLRFIVQQ